jgi:serine/threonine protein kinase
MSPPGPPPRPDGSQPSEAELLSDSDLVSEVSQVAAADDPAAPAPATQATTVASPRASPPSLQHVERGSAADLGPRQFFTVGRYQVHQSIASGGMASVHLGRLRGAAGFSRTVAIKRMHPHFAQDPDFEALFTDEARLAARIQHPNVVSTLDVVSAEGELLLVLEYVHGEALSRLLGAAVRDQERVAPEVTVAIMSGVLHGLHAAHEAKDRFGRHLGIVHRDVSPQNVLVGVDGVARVLDFGVAKAAGCVHTTREGLVRGKAAYMAPEQLEAQPVDRRTDIYSAGVVLWEMLVGERLSDTSEPAASMQAPEAKIDAPSTRVSGLPPAFDGVVMCALHSDPDQRYSTALEMADALESCARVATRTEVRQWVERLSGAALRRRAELVGLVESLGDSEAPPPLDSNVDAAGGSEPSADVNTAQGLSAESSPPRRVRRARTLPLLVGTAVALVIAAGLWSLQTGTRSSPTPSADHASSAPPAAATEASASSWVAGEPTSVSSYTAPSAASAAPVPETPPARARARPARSPKRTTPAGCNPPYYVSPDGVKHYKPECF